MVGFSLNRLSLNSFHTPDSLHRVGTTEWMKTLWGCNLANEEPISRVFSHWKILTYRILKSLTLNLDGRLLSVTDRDPMALCTKRFTPYISLDLENMLLHLWHLIMGKLNSTRTHIDFRKKTGVLTFHFLTVPDVFITHVLLWYDSFNCGLV